MGFANDVIGYGCLGYEFCFKIKEKDKYTFYINLYFIIFIQSCFLFIFLNTLIE